MSSFGFFFYFLIQKSPKGKFQLTAHSFIETVAKLYTCLTKNFVNLPFFQILIFDQNPNESLFKCFLNFLVLFVLMWTFQTNNLFEKILSYLSVFIFWILLFFCLRKSNVLFIYVYFINSW